MLQAELNRLLRPAIRSRPRLAARHRSFILSQGIAGGLALLAFPVYVYFAGMPGQVELIAFLWLMAPLLIAAFLLTSANIDLAHAISIASLTGLAFYLCAHTGGAQSYLIPWIIVIPIEAAMSGRRGIVIGSLLLSTVALIMLYALAYQGLLPPARLPTHDPAALYAIGGVAAIMYAGSMALSVQSVHRTAERAAMDGEARYRVLAHNMTDMVTCHRRGGEIDYASPATLTVSGYQPSDLMGRQLSEWVHHEDAFGVTEVLSRVAKLGGEGLIEFRLRLIDGGYRWVELRCRPMETPGAAERDRRNRMATMPRVVAVTRDISDRKADELELIEARDAAEVANRAKARFLANMSHELRTPLNAIIGFSQIIKDQTFGPLENEQYLEYANLINDGGQRLLDVVSDILDMSRIETGKYEFSPTTVDIAVLVSECAQEIEPKAAAARVTVLSNIEDGLPSAFADRDATKQILENLVSNAVKFSAEDSIVRVSARGRGSQVEISISDNGIGIPPDHLERIGTPFEQVATEYSRNHEGSGLGLSIVRGLTALQNGQFEIKSDGATGTTATVRLPRAIGGASPPMIASI